MIKSSHAHLNLSLMRLHFLNVSVQVRIRGREWHCGDRIHSDGVPAAGRLQTDLFFVFLVLYLVNMGGSLGMIVLIQSDPCLPPHSDVLLPQTPFLSAHFLLLCYCLSVA